ncbi:hypothetical protein ACFE04_014194 [Oxalis oulophora]
MVSIDRLSGLPEGLIIEILSRMETQYAVRTCVLSKRWTRLWTQLTWINLNLDSFVSSESFLIFFFGLLTHYDSRKLCSLKFVCTDLDGPDGRLVEAIIDYATVNQVLYLSIDSILIWDIILPPQLFASLEDLTLKYMSIQFPKACYAASLKSISLRGVSIENDILLNCINLEDFFMAECEVFGLSKIVISAPKLDYLHIQYERSHDDTPKDMMISISAPKLETIVFSFHCDSIANISLGTCPFLESVSIDFYHRLKSENEEDMLQIHTYAKHIVNFLNGVSDVSSLTLTRKTIMVLSAFPELVKNLPSPFKNLRSLEVLKSHKRKYFVVPPEVETFLVEGSPNASELLKGLQSDLEK